MTTDLTAQEIDELKRLEKAATPEPWHLHPQFDDRPYLRDADGFVISKMYRARISADGRTNRDLPGHENAAFIVATRNALPRLLAMVESLQGDVEYWRRVCTENRFRVDAQITELATLRRQIAECKATLELATASHNTLVSEIADKDEAIERLRQNVERLNKRCATYQRDFKAMFEDERP